MYQLRSQGVKAAAKEIDFIDQSVQTAEGIWRDCVLMYTRLRVKYVSIYKPRGYSCSETFKLQEIISNKRELGGLCYYVD